MAEVRNPTEPSMEEILASIRRIIIEDDDPLPNASADQREVTTEAATLASARAPGQTGPLRVAGLDASVAAAPSNFEPQLPSGSSPAQDAMLDVSRRIDQGDLMRREPEAISSAPLSAANTGRLDRSPSLKGTADTEPRTAGLAASVATLTKLASIGQAGRAPELPLGDIGRTLEDMVRELLRPHMKEWLDAHLPQLVERLVRDEIARLVREAQQH
jgi:uncharacterized protein